MGTAAHGHNVVVEARWLGLLQAGVFVQTQESLSEEGLAGAYKDMLGSWMAKARQMLADIKGEEEDLTEEGYDLPKVPKKAKITKGSGKRDHSHAKVSIPGGPCAHCGATNSPQWRRPADKDTTLCNACGIYYGRHGELPRGKSKLAQTQPQPMADDLTQPPSLPILTIPSPQAPPELQAELPSASAVDNAALPPNAVLVRPVRSRKPTYKLRVSPASSESQSGTGAMATAQSSRPASSPAHSEDSSGHVCYVQPPSTQFTELRQCSASHPLKRARSGQGLASQASLSQPLLNPAPQNPASLIGASEPATELGTAGHSDATAVVGGASPVVLGALETKAAAAPVFCPANVAAPASSAAVSASACGAVVIMIPVRRCKGPRRPESV